jgi:hypothetical protein
VKGKSEQNSHKNVVYQSGAGKYPINIANIYEVSLTLLELFAQDSFAKK